MIEVVLVFSLAFLSFLLVYGLLYKLKLFEKNVNVIISVVVSLFVFSAFYFYYPLLMVFFSILLLLLFIIFIILSFYFYRRSKYLNVKG